MGTGVTSVAGRLGRHSGVRFLAVGGLSAAVDAGALFVLHGLLGVWLPAATAISFLISLGVNFALNRMWTFEATTGATGRHALRYGLLVVANLALTVVLVPLLTWLGLPYLISKLCTTAVLSTANYFVSREWVFG